MSNDLETRVRRANPMTRPDHVEQIFGKDVSSRLLRDIREADRMTETTKKRTQTEPAPAPRRRGVLVAAGAAAITVLLAGTLLVIATNMGSDSAAPPAGTDPVAVVGSSYEALNAGDVDGWLEHFADGAFDDAVQTASLYEVLAAANTRIELVEPCRRLPSTSQAEAQVECTVLERNDFHGAGGITITRRETFTINQDSRISSTKPAVVAFTDPGYFVFAQAFWDWMRATYPEVHAENRPIITTHWPQEPEHIRTALEYLDEFLAQSDVYPITDGS